MQVLEAHALLFGEGDRGLLHAHGFDEFEWSPRATAAVILAGALDDARSLDDLHDGIRHFESLLSAEVVTYQKWDRESLRVVEEIFAFGRAWEARQRELAELN
ncbi:MAG: hypothetical protein AB7O68_19940 [Pirellulales bacterium]